MSKLLLLIILTVLIGSVLPFIYGAHFAFYLYQIIYFLNPENRWWSYAIPNLPYSKISVIILITTFIFKLKEYQTNKLFQIPSTKWLLFLLIYFAIVYFFAINSKLHLNSLIELFKMFVTIAIAFKVLDTHKKVEWAIIAFIAGATYLSYETHIVGRNSGDRVEGVSLIDAPDANATAAALVPAIPFLIYYFWLVSNKFKLLIVICGALIVNAMVLINSRGAFLGCVVGSTYFLSSMMLSPLKKKYQRSSVIVMIFLGIFGLSIVMDDGFIDRMNTLKDDNETTNGSERTEMWFATFDLLDDHPFGTGAYGFQTLSQVYVNRAGRKAVHSIWFQALSEVGWLGFFIFMMILYSSYRSLKKLQKKFISEKNLNHYFFTTALLSSLIGTLVTSTFIDQFRVQTIYWLILFTSCLYAVHISPSKKQVQLRS